MGSQVVKDLEKGKFTIKEFFYDSTFKDYRKKKKHYTLSEKYFNDIEGGASIIYESSTIMILIK